MRRDALYFPGLVPTKFSTIETFLRTDDHARRRLAEADEFLGYSLMDAYAEADVYDWEVYESGFMVVTLALADWALENVELNPVLCGGQSFGAIIAAVFSGALSYQDGLALVRNSVLVEVDYFDHQPEPLGCLFFYRMTSQQVDDLVAEFRAAGRDVEVSIYLDDSVHAVSGTLADLELLEARVREAGGFPFYTMNRSEHCPSVRPLRDRLETEVYDRVSWHRPKWPMLSDVSGKLLTDPEEIEQDLLDGWVTPVHWSTVVGGMRDAGTEQVHIIGPRNMFSRITNNALPTEVITPKKVVDRATSPA
ncbi:ACP S-malonyltransferase [Saccharopolyspora hordei]|uniref:[acyl-carrier-protein] S-malonyltransferase n=1 Tax=Saccharopolyspora hordei TaxID=1838 RepID=A0A853AEC8_9PSEU|nr:hypothetical protein [Saccharopolyspora hordei]NYI82298.1 [acyl-carrier-protein] S-malonyltransferase [Saccharopolyspora hordei]